MHTIGTMTWADFRLPDRAAASLSFDLPGHQSHGQRIVFVAPAPCHDLAALSGLVLALTHAFYERPEAGHPDFYDYPSHFVIGGQVGASPRVLHTGETAAWSDAWAQMDVWPHTHHCVAHPDAHTLLQAACMLETTLLIWPEDLPPTMNPTADGPSIEPHSPNVLHLLRNRLQAVVLYTTNRTDDPAYWQVIPEQGGAARLVREAVSLLPASKRPTQDAIGTARFRRVAPGEFLVTQRKRAPSKLKTVKTEF